MKQKLLLLIALIALNIPAWAEQVIILQEDFTGIAGNNTTTGGSSAVFTGTTNFPTSTTAYNAGDAIKVGSGSKIGSITSRALDLSVNGGVFTISFDVKGWTTVEGDVKVTTGCNPTDITKAYTAKMANAFETVTMEFTGGKKDTKIVIASTAKRAFIDNIKVYYEVAAPTAPTINVKPATLDPFSAAINQPASQTIKVGAINLTNLLELKISGADAGLFTVNHELLMPELDPLSPDLGKVADTDVTITYAPTAVGTHAATLTLSSLGAADITFELSGTATLPYMPAPVATEATAITEKSFTANWNVVPNATEYELHVYSINAPGSKENPYSVSDRISNTSSIDKGWVSGYIVGFVTNSGLVVTTDPSKTKNTNMAIADSPTETNGSKMIAVELPAGKIRDALNVLNNPNNIGKLIKIHGSFSSYFGSNGIKSPSDYVLDAVLGDPVAGSPFTITDATSFEITGLKHNTDYQYSVVAKGAEHLNSEPSNVITVKTADIIPTEVSSIGDITDTNVYYKVTEQLEGVYQVGNVAYVKGAIGGNPNKTTRPADSHLGGDLDDNFEQSSWMKITAPDAQNYEGNAIDAGLMGKLNAKTGAFDVVTMPAHHPKTDAYAPFYKSNTEKYNSFTLKNFFPQAPGYYFIAPQNNEVAFLSQLKYRENEPYFYITETKDGVTTEVKFKVIPTVDLPTDKLADDAIYNCKAIFLKQPKVENPQEMEWVFEHLGGGSITTGVNDIIVNGSDVKVIGTNGAIEVYAAQASAINVYNLSGAIVRSINNADSYTSINIPAGAYIVKVQNSVVKVIVK